MTQDRVLYANPAVLATSATNLILTTQKTQTHTVPFIPAESAQPLQVALINSTNALVALLHLWTQHETDPHDAEVYAKLQKVFSDIRTTYIKAQAKAQALDVQKGPAHE